MAGYFARFRATGSDSESVALSDDPRVLDREVEQLKAYLNDHNEAALRHTWPNATIDKTGELYIGDIDGTPGRSLSYNLKKEQGQRAQ